ncbi:MAG: DUF4623 domain-containing protein [Cyclonatronaceae bacterium]
MTMLDSTLKRKIRTFAALLLTAFVLGWSFQPAQAQVVLTDAEWSIEVGDEDWVAEDNTMRGGALNPVTGNLLVVSRTGAPAVYVVDPASGTVEGELSLEGVSGGTFPINLITVTNDGTIYAGNLAIPGQTFKVYRWDDEESEPVVALEDNLNNQRFGDAFGLYEDDDKYVILASGGGNDTFLALTYDKTDEVYSQELIDVPAGYARGGFGSVDGANQVWINGYGTPLTLVDLGTGDILLEVPESAIPFQNMLVDYAEIDGRSIAAVFPNDTEPEGQYVAIYDVTDAGNIVQIGRTAQLGPNENLNGVGAVDIDADSRSLYVVGTNNAVAKFDMSLALDAVPVVLNFNAATVPDTLKAGDMVQVRGAVADHDWENELYLGQAIRWNAESTILAENIGGDYWTATIMMLPGDDLEYKYWTGFSLDPEEATANGGWESSDNRILSVPAEQTEPIVLDLTFYNQVQVFEEKADSVGIHFRVNVGAQVQLGQFNPDNEEHQVGVRGTPAVFGNPEDWGTTAHYLELEDRMEDTDNVFYSGVLYVNEDTLADNSDFIYKFVTEIPEVGWEDDPNREASFTAIADTTLQYAFFNRERPTTEDVDLIETDVQFAVNVNILTNLGIFDDDLDGVELRGNFNGWSGGDELTFNPTLDRYQLTRSYSGDNLVAVGQRYAYKYFILWDESREDEESPNYVPNLDLGAGWEEPGTTGGSDRVYFIEDEPVQRTYPEDPGFVYYNDLPGAAVILQDFIEGTPETYPITIRIDMSRAASVPDAEEQFVPGQDSVFIAFEEQIFALTQGFGTGPEHVEDASNIVRNENYLLEDTNDDGIYEITIDAQLPSVNSLGFVIGYGQPNVGEGEILWNGGGFGSGRRYYQFITPTKVEDFDGVLVSSWPAEPELAVLDWLGGEAFDDDLLTVETSPDYAALATSADEGGAQTPVAYSLDQNYPNPFNPTTTIRFTIPESQDVRLDVYNVLGQRVATLVNTQMNAGTHTVPFDATRLASGMYIYRLQAGEFVQQRKMMLVK